MAEIKKYISRGNFNQPIGVVTPSSAGVRAAQSVVSTFSDFSDMFYKAAVIEQENVGREAGLDFRVRDADQNLVIKSAPKNLSPVALSVAEPIIDKRYQTEFLQDAKNRAAVLRKEHEGNPEAFQAAYAAYIDESAKEAGKYSNFVQDLGGSLLAENLAGITIERLEAEDKQAYLNEYQAIIDQMDDIEQHFSAGKYGVGAAEWGATERMIDELAIEHSDRISATTIPNLKKQLTRKALNGQVREMASNVQGVVGNKIDPTSKTSYEIDVLNAMEMALRQNSFSGISDQNKAILNKIGFDEEWLGAIDSQETRDILAGDISIIEGNVQEIYNGQKDDRLSQAISDDLSRGNSISKSDGDFLFKKAGISSGYDFLNNIDAVLQGEAQSLYHVMFRTNSELPDAVQDVFEDPNLLAAAVNQGKLDVVLDLYSQSTTRFVEGQVQFVPRGLDNKAVTLMESLKAYRTAGIGDTQQFFQDIQRIQRMPADARKAELDAQLGSSSYNKVTIQDFITDNVDPENFEQREFYSSFAEELVLIHGKKRAKEILRNSYDNLFVTSDVVYGNQKTIYDPKTIYSDSDDYNAFEFAVDAKLDLASNANKQYTFGDNAFLVADPRYGTVYPVYYLVDDNGVAIRSNHGQLLQVGPQSVLTSRQRRFEDSTIDAALLRDEARRQEEAFDVLTQPVESGFSRLMMGMD